MSGQRGEVTFTKALQRDGSYQINLLDFKGQPKVKDAEVEVLTTQLGKETDEDGGINNEDIMMGTIPENEMGTIPETEIQNQQWEPEPPEVYEEAAG